MFLTPFEKRGPLSWLGEWDDFFPTQWPSTRISLPAVNVEEKPDSFEVTVAVPGMKREDLKVEIDNGVLTISGKQSAYHEQKEKKYTRQEFSYSAVNRSFRLPENVDPNIGLASAECKEGVLRLRLAKKAGAPPSGPKSIPIK